METILPPVLIIGISSEARQVADALLAQGRDMYGYLLPAPDPKAPTEVNDIPVQGHLDQQPWHKMLRNEKLDYALAEPDQTKRKALMAKLFELTGKLPQTIAHPSCHLAAHTDLAAGNLLHAGCYLGPNVQMEACNSIGAGTLIEPDVQVGAYTTISLGCRIGAKAVIEDEAYLGPGAIVHPGITVGAGALVGAGSVVLKSVPAGATVFGVPAQIVKGN